MKNFIVKAIISLLFILGLMFIVKVARGVNYPNYTSYVNDYTNTLSQDFINKQNLKIKAFEAKTTDQIAIAVIETTDGESIEDYSIHLADKWQPGQKGKDNGVLMLFAMKDRTMRIEVGRGLEGDLTDLKSKQILDDVIKPEFKAGKYEVGIEKGIDSVILAISSPSAAIVDPVTESGGGSAAVAIIIIIIIIIIIFIAISPWTPLGGEGSWGISTGWGSSDSDSGSFGGGSFSGGGASSRW